jgi:hypothetical protein
MLNDSALLRRPSSLAIRRRGGALAIVFLVLAAIFLIAAIVGLFFARSGIANLQATAQSIGQKLSGPGTATIVSPGSSTVTLDSPGAILIGAFSADDADGRSFTYSAATSVTVSITSPSGSSLMVQRMQGNQPPIDVNGNQVFLYGFAEAPAAGEYSISVAGDETAMRAVSIAQSEVEAFLKGALGVGGGFLGVACGGVGFLLFGVIGGILMIFGRKKPQPI